MKDFHHFFSHLLGDIPATFWGVVVGSLFTLTGIYFTNRASDRRLRVQLQNDRELKNREREMTFRKDTYAASGGGDFSFYKRPRQVQRFEFFAERNLGNVS